MKSSQRERVYKKIERTESVKTGVRSARREKSGCR